MSWELYIVPFDGYNLMLHEDGKLLSWLEFNSLGEAQAAAFAWSMFLRGKTPDITVEQAFVGKEES